MMPAAQTRTRPDVRDVSFTPASSDLCETGMSAGHKRKELYTLRSRISRVLLMKGPQIRQSCKNTEQRSDGMQLPP